MRAVRSRDTTPELIVRRAVTALGYRYRLHMGSLPGTPDLVFKSRRKVIFVHGCFWHGHNCKRGAREPKSNVEYWRLKVQRNRTRDQNAIAQLAAEQWEVLVLWECEIKNPQVVGERLQRFLG